VKEADGYSSRETGVIGIVDGHNALFTSDVSLPLGEIPREGNTVSLADSDASEDADVNGESAVERNLGFALEGSLDLVQNVSPGELFPTP
jgi:hypothetical protein